MRWPFERRASSGRLSAVGRPLSAAEKDLYRAYFAAELLDGVCVHEGRVPLWLRPDMNAIALGKHVYFRPGVYVAGSAPGVEILGHELVHVAQFAQGMTVWKYLLACRRGYACNPYEVEAYAKAARIRADFCAGNLSSPEEANFFIGSSF